MEFVDYGNTETIPMLLIRKPNAVNEKVVTLPFQVCSLLGTAPILKVTCCVSYVQAACVACPVLHISSVSSCVPYVQFTCIAYPYTLGLYLRFNHEYKTSR